MTCLFSSENRSSDKIRRMVARWPEEISVFQQQVAVVEASLL